MLSTAPRCRLRVIKKGTFLTYRGDKTRAIYKNKKKFPYIIPPSQQD